MTTSSSAPFMIILLVVLVLMGVIAIFYLYFTARNRERLALIEKGMDPNLARGDFWLQAGVVGVGASSGLMLGDIIPGSTYGPLFAVLLAGVGLVVYNLLRRAGMRRGKGF